jgi:hypothetical protein
MVSKISGPLSLLSDLPQWLRDFTRRREKPKEHMVYKFPPKEIEFNYNNVWISTILKVFSKNNGDFGGSN